MSDAAGEAGAEDREIEAVIHPSDDGRFWAEVVGLPGCYAQGENYSKTIARLRDAHQLCSRAANRMVPPAAPLTLAAGTTVGQLIASLWAAGWDGPVSASEFHILFQHPLSCATLCLPADADEPLNSGFRKAITSYLNQ